MKEEEAIVEENAVKVAMMPKIVRNEYFKSCRQGANEAADALGVGLLWDGPITADARQQAELIRKWLASGIDGLAVSVENDEIVSPALREARKAGVKVLTWDADAAGDARDFFVNQATADGIAEVLSTEAARAMSGNGQIAMLTSTLDAPNQKEWLSLIRARFLDRYPDISVVAVRPTNEDEETARLEAEELLREHPQLRLMLAICAPAVSGAAETVKRAGRTDVKVIGTALPSACKRYIVEGWVESVVLWSTVDLGYLAVHAAAAAAEGRLKRGDSSLAAGRLGKILVRGDEIRLGRPRIYNKNNIDIAGS
ncbi:MAG: substrate-binding domain-containing protein [Vicinamibacteria bacterium]|nr:substrate-binding domain-containing protein [Vicinamibacteria bacterium]